MDEKDLAKRRLANEHVIQANERLIGLLNLWDADPDSKNVDLLRTAYEGLRTEHREACLEVAELEGVPAHIADLQWRECRALAFPARDASLRLTASEAEALEQWRAEQQADTDELKRRIAALWAIGSNVPPPKPAA